MNTIMKDRFYNPFDGSRRRTVPIEHDSVKYQVPPKKVAVDDDDYEYCPDYDWGEE